MGRYIGNPLPYLSQGCLSRVLTTAIPCRIPLRDHGLHRKFPDVEITFTGGLWSFEAIVPLHGGDAAGDG